MKWIIITIVVVLGVLATAGLSSGAITFDMSKINIDEIYDNLISDRGLTEAEDIAQHKEDVVKAEMFRELKSAKQNLFATNVPLLNNCNDVDTINRINIYVEQELRTCTSGMTIGGMLG